MLGAGARVARKRGLRTFSHNRVLRGPTSITAQAKEPLTIAYGINRLKDVFRNNIKLFREAKYNYSDQSLNPVKGGVRFVSNVEAARLKAFNSLRHPNLMSIHALLDMPRGNLTLLDDFASTLESYCSDPMRVATLAEYYTDTNGLRIAAVVSLIGQDFLRGVLYGLCAAHKQKIRLASFKDNIYLKHPVNQQKLYPMVGCFGSPAAY